MANRAIDNFAGFAVHSWILAIVLIFGGVMVGSSLIVSLSDLCWLLFSFGWVYTLLDALGVINDSKRSYEWTLGIFFLGGICAPLYWWKVIRARHVWADMADEW